MITILYVFPYVFLYKIVQKNRVQMQVEKVEQDTEIVDVNMSLKNYVTN